MTSINSSGKVPTSSASGTRKKRSSKRKTSNASDNVNTGGSTTSTNSNTSSSTTSNQQSTQQQQQQPVKEIMVKIGMLGEVQVGKTSLMVKYVENKFDEDYLMTLGVNFLEKKLSIKRNPVKVMIWDLAGQRDFMSMLDLVCSESVALLFVFDLTRKQTLQAVKEWYLQSRKHNKKATPFLIGSKYDKFIELPENEQASITRLARKYADKMKAPLIFSSSAVGINVKKLFKLILCKIFDLKPNMKQLTNIGEPIFEWRE